MSQQTKDSWIAPGTLMTFLSHCIILGIFEDFLARYDGQCLSGSLLLVATYAYNRYSPQRKKKEVKHHVQRHRLVQDGALFS